MTTDQKNSIHLIRRTARVIRAIAGGHVILVAAMLCHPQLDVATVLCAAHGVVVAVLVCTNILCVGN